MPVHAFLRILQAFCGHWCKSLVPILVFRPLLLLLLLLILLLAISYSKLYNTLLTKYAMKVIRYR